jgi:transposase-like protein
MDAPRTLQQAILFFSNPDRCFAYAIKLRWPDGVITCPRCNSSSNSFIKTRKIWYCNGCKRQFSVKVNTVFEDSALGLDKWFIAMWMLANCKNGVSSYEISRTLGITQKSAWHLLHRIRQAMADRSTGKLGGGESPIEVDETFVGGKVKNMHSKKRKQNFSYQGGGNKAIVLGMLERGGKIKTRILEDRKKANISPVMTECVEPLAKIITDEFPTYGYLETPYRHEVINHAIEYVRGHVHTNGIENFWSLLKRGLRGTYISVEPAHLEAYVAEQVFRYNNRKNLNDKGRFEHVMTGIAGHTLSYAKLIGGTGAATSL